MRKQIDTLQAQRDLHWVVTSPSLAAPIAEGAVIDAETGSQTLKHLQQIRDNPTALGDHLQARDTHFLGSYFEALWEFWLMQQPHLEIVARRKQVHEAGKTLGEFDFILFDHNNDCHVHQELAVKFYLGTSTTPFLWYGPNANDRFDLKLRKLQHQQLRFSENTTAQAWLREANIRKLRTELVMKGYLFYPHNLKTNAPLEAAPDHLRGAWLYQSDITELKGQAEAWAILPKAQWLSPAQGIKANLLSFDTMRARTLAQPTEDQRPVLVAAMGAGETDWVEQERFFIMPAHWPSGRKTSDSHF